MDPSQHLCWTRWAQLSDSHPGLRVGEPRQKAPHEILGFELKALQGWNILSASEKQTFLTQTLGQVAFPPLLAPPTCAQRPWESLLAPDFGAAM